MALYHISNMYLTCERQPNNLRKCNHKNMQIELVIAFAGESKSNITKQDLAWNPQGQQKQGICTSR